MQSGMNKNQTGALVTIVVAIAIALALMPTIAAELAPLVAKDGLAATIWQFLMTLYATAILTGLFGITVYLGNVALGKGGNYAELIIAVVTLLVGVALAVTVSDFSLQAQAGVSGPCAANPVSADPVGTCSPAPSAGSNISTSTNPVPALTGAAVYVGSWGITLDTDAGKGSAPDADEVTAYNAKVATRTAALAQSAKVGSAYGLSKTIASFFEVGYALSMLAAVVSMANVGSGGRVGGFARGGYQRLRGGMGSRRPM